MSKALVLGCGASGIASVRFLKRRGWIAALADTRESPSSLAEFRAEFPDVPFTGGTLPDDLLAGCDALVSGAFTRAFGGLAPC